MIDKKINLFEKLTCNACSKSHIFKFVFEKLTHNE